MSGDDQDFDESAPEKKPYILSDFNNNASFFKTGIGIIAGLALVSMVGGLPIFPDMLGITGKFGYDTAQMIVFGTKTIASGALMGWGYNHKSNLATGAGIGVFGNAVFHLTL